MCKLICIIKVVKGVFCFFSFYFFEPLHCRLKKLKAYGSNFLTSLHEVLVNGGPYVQS